MRLRTLGLAAALSASLVGTSDAVVQHKGAEDGLVTAGQPARGRRTTLWSRPSELAAVGLPGWSALWDRDTDVPLRLWGASTAIPGAVTHPAIAEAAARQFLAKHLALLAPGAAVTDFVVVANQLSGSGDVRSIGFAQHAGGVPVLGGAIGFSFKADRLVMVSSTALPDVAAPGAPYPVAQSTLSASAIRWLAADGHKVQLRSTGSRRVIVPVIHSRGSAGPEISYHLAEQLSVEALGAPGRWDVWVDARDGGPIARQSTISFASGTVMFNTPDRWPGSTRSAKPAAKATHTVNGESVTADMLGNVSWSAGGAASVSPGLAGPLVEVINEAGSAAATSFMLNDGGSITWDAASIEFDDAQLSAYVFASTAKEFTRQHLNPNLEYLDEQLAVVVNENDSCNAFSTGDDIHFFRKVTSLETAGNNCENTARLADVVYHEFGHSLHRQSIIPGVGAWDGALSEGMGDILAMVITGDHGMARGFFLTGDPLRELDPEGFEKRYPDHLTGEVHDDGEIIGQTMWDLRKGLIAELGETAGIAAHHKIFYGIMQRASDLPSTYLEALVSDDDDGNLTNGTPNLCAINAAFGMHGLADPRVSLGLAPPVRDGRMVSITAAPPTAGSECPGPSLSSAMIEWKLAGGAVTQIAMTGSGNAYTGEIPAQADGAVVQYKVVLSFSDGTKIAYPDNPGDPYYQVYLGEVEQLWCTDFEAGADDWTHGAEPTSRDEWEVGPPMGLGSDPSSAHSGTNVFGLDLSTDGNYRRNGMMWAESPEIDLAGNTNVRLQYHRWLGVEDGFYDGAQIVVNGTPVWNSYISAAEPQGSGISHIDREWRFHDVDLSAQAGTGKLKLRFELNSDQGFNLGGWTLDDVCIVVAKAAPACEDGSAPPCEGSDGDGTGDEAGCCSTTSSPVAPFGLALFVGGLLIRRRRRARA
ncbi:MAG: hypothetical protein AB7O24_15515 [Kofleriaceae bacterium]